MGTSELALPARVPCQTCNGQGRGRWAHCRACAGVGTCLQVADVLACWGWTLSVEEQRQFAVARRVRLWLRAALIGYAVLVTVAVGAMMVPLAFVAQETIYFSSAHLFFIALGAAALLVVFTSIRREASLQQSVIRLPQAEWQEAAETSVIRRQVHIERALTIDAILATERAARLSASAGHTTTTCFHLGLSLLGEGPTVRLLSRLGVSPREVARRLSRHRDVLNAHTGESPVAVYWQAYLTAARADRKRIDSAALFVALAELDHALGTLLFDLGIDHGKLVNVLLWGTLERRLVGRSRRVARQGRRRPRGGIDRAMTAVATPLLNTFSEDLTEAARAGMLLPTVGRPEVTNAVVRALAAGQSPLLVGHRGVGKRGVLEDIAERMVAEDVPSSLKDKRLVALSLPRLVSGASAEIAESRVLSVLGEAARAGNIVLVIEDVHGAVGITAGSEGSVDLGQVLTNALRVHRGRSIATTTPEDYRQHVEGTALGNFFTKTELPEPSRETSIAMVESRLALVEVKQKMFFSYDAVARLVEQTDRFVTDKYLPKKAVELLHELASFARRIHPKEPIVLADDVDRFLEEKLKIPARRLSHEESSLLLEFEDRVHEQLVNQDMAVRAVADALRRARAEVRDTKRPVVNLLFLGPTGVGKTQLAKTAAELYFGSEGNMIRVDMSEYQDLRSIERLIGAPSGERGVLTEAVRAKPFGLVLLDEIDKAHPDVLNLFLQVMDDGRLTDARGVTIDFTNVMLIMTSNAGAQFIQDSVRAGESTDTITKALLETELKQSFRPEFLNRFDGLVVFEPLSPAHVRQVTELLLRSVGKRLDTQGIGFQFTPAAVDELADQGYDPAYGARPLRRVIQNTVDSTLARMLLQGNVQRRDTVILDKGGKLRVDRADSLT